MEYRVCCACVCGSVSEADSKARRHYLLEDSEAPAEGLKIALQCILHLLDLLLKVLLNLQ